MNKDDVAGLVERLQKHIFYGDARLFNFKKHSPLAMEAADALTTLSAENERLEAACQQYLNAFDAGTGTVYVEPEIRKALESQP